ncbi:MAG: thrombospondin type 3 repeat-containing protein, partial [Candidatus Nitrosotenuis sp.]
MALEGSTVFIILVLVSGLVPYSQISFASAQLADKDADGVPDDLDNCPNDPNPLQEDIDSDGIGDACQTGDQDGDGIPN